MVVVACVVVEGEKVSLKVEKEEGKNGVKKKGSQSPRSTTKGEKKTRGKRTRRKKRDAGPTPPPPIARVSLFHSLSKGFEAHIGRQNK